MASCMESRDGTGSGRFGDLELKQEEPAGRIEGVFCPWGPRCELCVVLYKTYMWGISVLIDNR